MNKIPMSIHEFNNRLTLIVDEARDRMSSLVMEAFEREDKDIRSGEPISFRYEWNFNDEEIDNLIQAAGWVHDRLNGITRYNRRSLTKKLRKALGFSIP